jgi:hypothetical protein
MASAFAISILLAYAEDEGLAVVDTRKGVAITVKPRGKRASVPKDIAEQALFLGFRRVNSLSKGGSGTKRAGKGVTEYVLEG